MIRHLLRLIWNKKRKNVLLMVEVCLAFLVLFTVFSIGIYNWQNYKKPLGYHYENVLSAYTFWDRAIPNKEVKEQQLRIKQAVLAFPEVEVVAYSRSNVPFGNSNWSWGIDWKDRPIQFNHFVVDPDFFDLMGMELMDGRFFSEDDRGLGRPVVITKDMEKQLFPNGEKALGIEIPVEDEEAMKVVGVIDMYRYQSEFAESSSGVFELYNYESTGYPEECLVMKLKDGTGNAFQESLFKEIHSVSPGFHFELSDMNEQRENRREEELLPITIFLIIAAFLILNVALGLFGVLWYNVNSRKSEIGLRRAMGASSDAIVRQIMSETLILVAMAMTLGVFIAIQLPLLNVYNVDTIVYVMAIVAAILFLSLIVIVCSWYPGKKTAEIQPAIALHEE